MKAEIKKRDKQIVREIHKLFHEANMQAKWLFVATYVFRIPSTILLNAVAPLFAALGVQAILDGNQEEVYMYAWLTIGAAIIYSVMSFLGTMCVNKNGVIGSNYLVNKLFRNFLDKDYEFYANRFTGSLGEQITRVRNAYNEYGYLVTAQIPHMVATLGASLLIVGYFSPELALVTFAAIVIIVGTSLFTSQHRRKYRRQVSQITSTLTGQITDALSHGATVKSFASDDAELERLQKPLRIWKDVQFRSWMSMEQFNIPRALLTSVAVAGLLVVSLWLYQDEKIPAAIVVLVQVYVIRLVMQTLMFGDMVKLYEQIISASYDPVQTMLVQKTVRDPEYPRAAPEQPLELALQNVGFRYAEAKKSKEALHDIDFIIRPGEKIGLVGHSGSGKTTLTKLLLRFMDTTSGEILINGLDIRELRQKDVRRMISYVPQEPLLFHRSIYENISYGNPNASKKDVVKAAKLAYVDEFVKDLPEGYDTLVGERGVKLSGGQRQRVAIARALLKDAPVLVLDEATSALDSQSEKYIQDALWELMKDRTAIVIAHRLSTIQRMDRIVVLDKGAIAQVGTHDKLRKQPGIYAELWAHQSGGYIVDNSDTN